MGEQYRVYGYRWVVLAVFMLVNFMIQLLWISYAPVTSLASDYYGVSELAIGVLSMVFMIAYIPLSVPAAWLIDTRGFRVAVGLGVVLMGIFGLLRGLAGDSYALALAGTIGLAVAQPFLMNSYTKVPANWFAPNQRATAVSLATLASMLGIAAGMVATPALVDATSISTVQLIYGALAAGSAVAFLALAREKPATPPCPPGMEERALMFDGLKHAIRVRPFVAMLVVAFISMSCFNGVTTWVEQIIAPRGFSPTEAGTMGGLMLIAGVVGAVVLSALSDRRGKRIRYQVIVLVAAIPGMLGIAFASSVALLYVFSAWLGFFLVASLPLGLQYAAEITHPTPEGTSSGLMQLAGQVSVVWVYVMEALRSSDGAFTTSLLLSAAMLAACAVVVSRLRDSAPLATTMAAETAGEAAGATGEAGPAVVEAAGTTAEPAGTAGEAPLG